MLLITLGLSFNYFTTAYELVASKTRKWSHCTYCNVNTQPGRDKDDNMERCQSNVHDTQIDNPETHTTGRIWPLETTQWREKLDNEENKIQLYL